VQSNRAQTVNILIIETYTRIFCLTGLMENKYISPLLYTHLSLPTRCAVVLTQAADLASSRLQSMKASFLVLIGIMHTYIHTYIHTSICVSEYSQVQSALNMKHVTNFTNDNTSLQINIPCHNNKQT
jgi:hypothetical protein